MEPSDHLDHHDHHERKHYVVSQDLDILLGKWIYLRWGVHADLDYERIRTQLSDILSFNGHHFVSIDAQTLTKGMARLLRGDPRPIVSVDPVYWPSELMLQLTRCVDVDREKIEGIHPRFGFPSCEEQFARIADRVGATIARPMEITLVDDVVYSGSVVKAIAKGFRDYGVRVSRVVCGIAVAPDDGTDPVSTCAQIEVQLDYVCCYGINGAPQAVDEVCERDFFVFCPMAGRTLKDAPQDTGVPYIAPFGLPDKWATFDPAHEPATSQLLIRLNVDTLEMIECAIGQSIKFADLQRVPLGVRHPNVEGESVREHLTAHLT